MAAENVYAAAFVSGDVSNPANAVGTVNGTWAGLTNSNTSWTGRWRLANPTVAELDAVPQTITVTARKGSNSNNPTIQINLYQGGTQVASSTTQTVTSTAGATYQLAFTPPAGTSSQNLEVEVIATASGGSPSARNSVEIDAIQGNLQTAATVPNTLPVAVASAAEPYTTEAPIALDGTLSYDPDGTIVSYAWGYNPMGSQSGSGTWANQTSAIASFHPDTAGGYSLQLTVTDDRGGKDTATLSITVEEPPPTATKFLFDGTTLIPLGDTVIAT